MLIQHGEADTSVSVEQSRKLAEALRKAGKTCTLITYPNEDHPLSGHSGGFPEALAWFQKCLGRPGTDRSFDSHRAAIRAVIQWFKSHPSSDSPAPTLMATPAVGDFAPARLEGRAVGQDGVTERAGQLHKEVKVERKTLLLDLLKQAHGMETAFVDALSGQERACIGTHEDWSAKDVISHITARKALMADGLLAVAEARTPIGNEDLDHENAVLFEEYHDKTWDEVLKLAANTFQRIVTQVESLGEQELARCEKFFSWQGDRPLWRLIVGSGYIHPIAHVAEFYRKHGEREQAAEMIEQMSRSMAGLDDSPVWQGDVKYNLACHYALLGATAKAIRELQEALALNPGLVAWSRQDPDLDAIRGESEYQALYT